MVKKMIILDDIYNTGNDSISSLLPLLGLRTVTGDLRITCKKLRNYYGLDSLEYVNSLTLPSKPDFKFTNLKEVEYVATTGDMYEEAFPSLKKINALNLYIRKSGVSDPPINFLANNKLRLGIDFFEMCTSPLNILPTGQSGLQYLNIRYSEGGTTRGLDQLSYIDTLIMENFGQRDLDGLFDMSYFYNIRYIDKLMIGRPNFYPVDFSPKGLKNAFLSLNAVGSVVIEVGGDGIDEVRRVFPNLRQLRYGFGIINTQGFTSLDFLDRLGPIPEDRATIGEYTSFFPYLINRKYYKFAFVDNKDLVDCNSKYLCRVLDRYPELVLFRGNGCDSMDVVKYCESIDLTVAEDLSIDDMVAFPNPASDRLYIAGTHTSRSRYTLWNSMGQQVQQGITEDNEIDLSSLPGGIYLLEIEVEDGKLWRDRVVVE